MLCNISQNAMRQRGAQSGNPPGGYPDPPPPGGYPVRSPPAPGGYPVRYPPAPGGYPDPPPPGGVPGQVPPPPQPGQKEYSLHGGRYASCVHAGGLSCYLLCCKCDIHYVLHFLVLSTINSVLSKEKITHFKQYKCL